MVGTKQACRRSPFCVLTARGVHAVCCAGGDWCVHVLVGGCRDWSLFVVGGGSNPYQSVFEVIRGSERLY